MKRVVHGFLLAAVGNLAAAGPAQLPVRHGDAGDAVLRWGTPVALDTTREINSAEVVLGQRIGLEVADDIMVDGHVAVAKGSPAVGEVSGVTRKGNWGQRGRLSIRLLYVRVGDRMVRVSGDMAKQGHNGTGGTVAAVAAIGVVGGFLVTGTSAIIPPGTGLNGYIDEDVPLLFGPPAVRAIVYSPRDAPAVLAATAR